uniref:Secreted protein n=1 Tax=Anopheles minimus TaxID=112268 RepID=A0A182W1V4_9DIPT
MIRPILPILAYMSVLSSTYSLHMARDAYIKPPPPPPPAQLLDDLDDMSELLAENGVDLMRPMMGTVHQKTHERSGTNGGGGAVVGGSGSISNGAVALGTINHVTSNELPELSPPPAHLPSGLRHGPIGPLVGQPPRGLQELFGVQTNFDIRAAQQQLSHGPNGATSTFDVNQSSSSSGMDDRDDDNGEGGGEDGGRSDGGDGINGAAAGGGGGGGQGNANIQRSASSNKRASPTGGRNKMMADSGQDVGGSSSGLPSIPHGIANQMMLRSTRGQRQYDVPQIVLNKAK